MTVCIFLGPTLPAAEARAVLAAEYLPPVRQGDVYRALVRHRPQAIGIVDGYFHQMPSVWHKEILFAMAEGVHVFGSASMGALRAAELASFGMEGVGRVFAAFRDGTLEDDDEVAVVHGPSELGFLAASEAMVNIRWTLDAAVSEAIITSLSADHLKALAKALFYPKRSYAELLKRGSAQGLACDQLAALETWLERGRIDVKREDALAMLDAIGERFGGQAPAKTVGYSFAHTTMWEALRRSAGEDNGTDEHSLEAWLMDELRLDDGHDELRNAALLRKLALAEAERQGLAIEQDELQRAVTAFRLERNLQRGADLRAWLEAHDLDRPALDRLLAENLLLDKLTHRLGASLAPVALDQLRLSDRYEQLIERVRAKQEALASIDDNRELTGDGDALTCYFNQRHEPRPDDFEAYARQRGFRNGADFRRAALREVHYRRFFDEATIDDQ